MVSLKFVLIVSVVFYVINFVSANPFFASNKRKKDVQGGLGVCLRNCAQCKKMFGNFFEGQMCADACVKLKGKEFIPDCEDHASIAPFLIKID